MEIKSKFDHFNINVTNLERSIAFYEKALGLKEHHRKEAAAGAPGGRGGGLRPDHRREGTPAGGDGPGPVRSRWRQPLYLPYQ